MVKTTACSNLETSFPNLLILRYFISDCFKREFGARHPNDSQCITPWRRTILGLPEPSESDPEHCLYDGVGALIAKENNLAEDVIFGPCWGGYMVIVEKIANKMLS